MAGFRMLAVTTAAAGVLALVVVLRRRRRLTTRVVQSLPDTLRSFPKVELHVHLDGSFDASLLYTAAKARLAAGELSAEAASKVAGCGGVHEFANLVACQPSDKSLGAMLERFMFFLPFVQGDLAALEALACRFVAQQAANNVLYTEVRYSPHVLTRSGRNDDLCQECGVSPKPERDAEARAVVEAITRGLRRGVAEHPGTEIVQILCFMDARPQWATSLQSLATDAAPSADLSTCPVVGVDIAAGESHFSEGEAAPSTTTLRNGSIHRAGMCKCAAVGLGLTNHAGESGPAANVAAAMSTVYGGARRVGHG